MHNHDSLLTDQQASELHKAMIAYLTANNLSEIAAALRKELGCGEDQFSTDTAKKYEGMLEKKWTSIARLQKKIMELESRSAELQSELDNTNPASRSLRNQDPSLWLPSTARYSLESHRDKINCVAFHPIFTSVASGSEDCTIKIWDWELGELERTLKGHTRAVRDIDYGGPRDNILVASCSSDMSIKLWKPTDGYKNIRTLQGHDHIVSSVRFIPSGNLLVSASKDTDIRIWDVITGFCVKTINGHTGWVRDVSLSFDGRYLLSCGHDMTAHLWDISTVSSPVLQRTFVGHDNFNECCALAPATSFQFLAPLAGLGASLSAGAVSFLATGSRDKNIKIWDARGTCLLTLEGHDTWVQALVFHPGGRYLLSVSDDKTLRCWDLRQQGRCVKKIEAHESFVTCLRWAPGIARSVPSIGGGEGYENDFEIRCVLATGGWNKKLKIFMG